MKLSAARWNAFLNKPDSAIGAALVFGPDRGLVRERADQLAHLILGSNPDPFRVVELTAGQLRSEPAVLADEAHGFGLVPGRRLLRLRDATDVVADAVRLLFSSNGWEAFLLMEAGDLGKRSVLRDLVEVSSNAAAVACYEDDAETLRHVIRTTLAAASLTATSDIIDALAAQLGSDRAVTRSELEKLVLYVGAGSGQAPRPVTLEDIAVVVGDARTASFGAIGLAAGMGNRAAVARALGRAAAEGLEPIALLRMLTSHLQRLYLVVSEVAAGRPLKDAMASLRPPIFFREIEAFARQVPLWAPVTLETALMVVLSAEIACKQTGAPQRLLAERACQQIAALALGRRASAEDRRG